MPILYNEKHKIFHLKTCNSSYVFKIDEYGYLLSLHYGAKINSDDDISYFITRHNRGFSANFAGAANRSISLDTMPNEFPVFGSGDFRHSAILTVDNCGNRLENLTYKRHSILKNKPKIKGMPSLRGGETLIVELTSANLIVSLYYTIYPDEDAIVRRTSVTNERSGDIIIQRLCSASLDLPDANFDILTLHGRHCSECNIERTRLRHGLNGIYSNRGASSAQHNPFMCLLRPQACENYGEVYSFNYVYGGNHLLQAEVDQFDTVRIQCGFNPFDFSWLLKSGETLETPETVLIYSCSGLGGMSRRYHDLYRKYLINPIYVNGERPIVINNWEATYFDFNSQKLFDIIDGCKGLGIDTFVLDDGWFGKRDDDVSGLGDWYVNLEKLPGGLDPIIERCKQNGLKFGLWFEPEMISVDSDLYRTHPDWCIHVDGIPPAESRGQLVLDLSRKEIVNYLKKTVGEILSSHDISYVKWDFNRHITDAYSSSLPNKRQQELCHRYMLGFYELAEYLTSQFPHILFEGCSGGGGRFDPSMLYYFPQYWTSDCSDAYERSKIQYGTGLCYPLSTQTGHVSVCPNHQTGRNTPFDTRSAIASLCGFGYELDPLKLNKEERDSIKKQTVSYNKLSHLVTSGDLYRLSNPFENGEFCYLIVSKDKESAHLTYMSGLAVPNPPQKRLRLQGLNADSIYHLEELNLTLSGQTLCSAGIPLPIMWGDFGAFTLTITKI